MWLSNAAVLWADGQFRRGHLRMENGVLAEITAGSPPLSAMDLQGRRVLPGLIDLHIHGYAGAYVMDEDITVPERLSLLLAQQGVTSYVPTTTVAEEKVLLSTLRRWAVAAEQPATGAVIRGLYMEGPFLSPHYKGAMREECIRLPDIPLAEAFRAAGGGWLKLLTIAPEQEGADALLRWCAAQGIIASIGHTAADYETPRAAFAGGAAHVTHLCNAMTDLRHREPGVLGAALDSDVTVELIGDGFHIHPAVVRMLYRLLGDDRIVLISDNTPISGSPDGQYQMDGVTSVVKDGTCRLENGTINGNMQPLLACVFLAADMGIPLASAVKMATETPARRLGIADKTGSLSIGKDADLVVLEPDNTVYLTMVRGRIVYKKDDCCTQQGKDRSQ